MSISITLTYQYFIY